MTITKEDLIKRFTAIKDVVISENYLALEIRTPFFRYGLDNSFPVFNYIYSLG